MKKVTQYHCQGHYEGEPCTAVYDTVKDCKECEMKHAMSNHITVIGDINDEMHTLAEMMYRNDNCTPVGINKLLIEMEGEFKKLKQYIRKNIHNGKKVIEKGVFEEREVEE
jgi:hypothetical protein